MKNLIVSVVTATAFVFSTQAADITVKLSKVHLCCQSCVNNVNKTMADIKGITAVADRDAKTISLTGPDAATVQTATDALIAAGYFGTSSDASIKLNATTGAKGQKMTSLQVSGVHLCCGTCVTVVDETLKAVSGVKGHTAAKGAKSFEVTGDYNDKDVFDALQKAGLSGQAK
mgnify:CR=1 FL=1